MNPNHPPAGRPIETGEIVIRAVRPEEWAALRALRLRALADAPDAFGATLEAAAVEPDDAWRDRTRREGSVLLVADRRGEFVGMAGGGPAPVEDHVAGLYSMWVAPEARGTGVADALVEAIATWAHDAGYPVLGLGVTTTNERAIAFYRRMGFTDQGTRLPLRAGSDLEIQIMSRPLR